MVIQTMDESIKLRKGATPHSPSMFKRRDPPSQFIGNVMQKAGESGPGPRYHTPVPWEVGPTKKSPRGLFIPVAKGWK